MRHRAAVVLWSRERTFLLRAKSSPAWAVKEVSRVLRAGDVAGARERVRSLLPFRARVTRAVDARPKLLVAALGVARGLDDVSLAAGLLAPFLLEEVSARAAPGLRAFVALARRLLETQAEWLTAAAKTARAVQSPKSAREALSRLVRPFVAILDGSRRAGAGDLHAALVGELATNPVHPVLWLVDVLHGAHEAHPETSLEAQGLASLHTRCVRALEARVASPGRAPDDWSIAPPGDCSCALCRTLGVRHQRAAGVDKSSIHGTSLRRRNEVL